jgi:hypothetical protein
MTITDWEKSLGLPPLPPLVREGESGNTVGEAGKPVKPPAAKKKAKKKK